MSVDTFVPPLTPSPGTSDAPEIKILKTDFGDGYTQAARAGLNNVRRIMTLKWDVVPAALASEIIAFFVAHGGTDPFLYKVPGETTAILWTCESFEESFAAYNYRSITATLRQSFNLV